MKILLRLWPYLKQYKLEMVIIITAGLVMSLVTGSFAYLLKLLFDAWEVKDEKLIYLIPIVMVGAYFIHGAARYIHMYLMKYTMERIIAGIRIDLQKKFLKLNLTYHFNYRSGGAGLLSQILNDVNILIQGLVILIDMVREPVTVVILFSYMCYLDWQLTLFCLIFIPLLIGILSIVTKGLRKHSKNQLRQLEDMSGSFKETLDGIRVIQSFNLEDKMHGKLDGITNSYLKTRKSIYKREEASGPLSEFAGSIIFAAIAVIVGRKILSGESSVGEFIGFITAAFSLQPALKKLQSGYVKIQQSIVATERITDTLANPNEVYIKEKPIDFPVNWKKITFKNVSFSYKENLILKKLNLTISRGEVIALVGESGSGKSTIINLLMRFFEPNEGEILLDSINIRDLDLKILREQIALVSQDVFLFNESIAENVRNGDTSKEAPVEACIQAANAAPFIKNFENGIDTRVGERGSLLSGGEKQRLSIARAFYKDSPVLVLDEATSALDSVSEQEVQKGIDQLMKGRTAIVIAHRLSTIIKADTILVLKNGEIVESGCHQDLLNLNGDYAKYYELQS